MSNQHVNTHLFAPTISPAQSLSSMREVSIHALLADCGCEVENEREIFICRSPELKSYESRRLLRSLEKSVNTYDDHTRNDAPIDQFVFELYPSMAAVYGLAFVFPMVT